MRGLAAEALGADATPFMMALSLVMFVSWTWAYVAIIVAQHRDRAHGVPMICIFLNLTWEFTFSFGFFSQEPGLFVWGNRFWLLADAVIFAQYWRNARRWMPLPFMQRHFWPVALGTFVLCASGEPLFIHYVQDVYGVITSFMINLLMSVLYLFLLASRPNLEGLRVSAAWLKMIGTFTGGLLCLQWYPEQFANGVLAKPPHVPEPPGFAFLAWLVGAILVIDVIYVVALTRRSRSVSP